MRLAFRWTLFAALLTASAALAATPVPQAPRYYVLDEPGVLSAYGKQSLEHLLVSHDRLTSEQIVVAIFSELGPEDAVGRTTEVFKAWQIGQAGKDNGLLIALYWKEHKIRIEVGYGLEPIITDARAKQLIDETLTPALKQNDPDGALLASVKRIFEWTASPLLQEENERALLQHRSNHRPLSAGGGGSILFWVIVAFLGLGGALMVIAWIAAAEAHFSRAGWDPAQKRFRTGARRSSLLHLLTWSLLRGGGGGWGGGSGGGGGFGGGGGRSGGGGASGSW